MRGLIERYVREMVKIPSTSNTEMEKNVQTILQRNWQSSLILRSIQRRQGKISAARGQLRPVCALGSGKRKWRIP